MLKKIFSLENEYSSGGGGKTKVITVLGIKIKIKTRFAKIYSKRFKGLTKKELEYCIKHQFKAFLKYNCNLDNPKTFNEKLAWLKLNYTNPLMTICADKVKARDYFLEKTKENEQFLVKQYGVYNTPDEIDFDKLPNEFVLKSNWGSGQQIIVKDKSKINIGEIKAKMANWIKKESNHYFMCFENSYKDIQPKIVCEEFLDFEYKMEFFCFNGEPKFFWIVLNDKTPDTKANFYTLDWEKMPLVNHYPNFEEQIEKPSYYDKMLEIAKKLCGDFPFVRCDFYKTKDSWKFSEITFYHWGGTASYEPFEFDKKIGDMLKLPV